MSHDTSTAEARADVARTRQNLADTVQALAARADVPTRVRDQAGHLQRRLTGLGARAREKAPQVRDATLTKASRSVPEPARRKAGQVTGAVAARPAALYAVAGTCVAAGLLLWKRGRS
jgi:Protein of unknown function (DUF3618)